MVYATVNDVQARMIRQLTQAEQNVCAVLLEDAAVVIDCYKATAPLESKKLVSIRIAVRMLGDGSGEIPVGATQSTMSGLGYSQSWTIGSGGASGEVYLSKTDKQILGGGNSIGSYSPVEEFKREVIL